MKNSQDQNLEHIIRRMQSDTAIDAPADAVRYAKNLFRLRETEPKRSLVQRLLAVAQIDLAPNRAAFGERSASEGQARQILFEAGDNSVDLRIMASGKGFNIRGQILGNGFENGEVSIVNGGIPVKAKIDEMSGFKVINLAAGDYSLTIRGGSNEIFIERLTLK
jgi:hypothetical protein